MAESTWEKGDDPDAASVLNTKLYVPVKPTQWPIVYAPEYNIGFLGLEKLHPFDAGKWGKVYDFLKEAGLIRDDTTVRPNEASEEDLLVVHTKKYLSSLKLTSIVEGTVLKEWSITVAGITEVPPVALLPNFIVQRKVLRPFRYQTGGTILAARLAVERGWGLNIGGGFHHCSGDRGGGFCAYADITLAIKFLFHSEPSISKAMIVDLDAHQGNGHERDFMDDPDVYIMDVYNRGIYPHDGFAKRAIKRKVELQFYTEDDEYLSLVRRHLEGALNEFEPDILVYNAGTDILEGDPLGALSITPQGIIERDQIVFQKARTRGIPILMVTSGGYQKTTARIIADSILNLRSLGLVSCDEAENAPLPTTGENSKGIHRSSSEGGLFAKLKRTCLSPSSSSQEIKSSADSSQTDQPLEGRPGHRLSKSASELRAGENELFTVEVEIDPMDCLTDSRPEDDEVNRNKSRPRETSHNKLNKCSKRESEIKQEGNQAVCNTGDLTQLDDTSIGTAFTDQRVKRLCVKPVQETNTRQKEDNVCYSSHQSNGTAHSSFSQGMCMKSLETDSEWTDFTGYSSSPNINSDGRT